MVYTAHHDCSVTKIQCIPLVYLQHHRHMSVKTTNFMFPCTNTSKILKYERCDSRVC